MKSILLKGMKHDKTIPLRTKYRYTTIYRECPAPLTLHMEPYEWLRMDYWMVVEPTGQYSSVTKLLGDAMAPVMDTINVLVEIWQLQVLLHLNKNVCCWMMDDEKNRKLIQVHVCINQISVYIHNNIMVHSGE